MVRRLCQVAPLIQPRTRFSTNFKLKITSNCILVIDKRGIPESSSTINSNDPAAEPRYHLFN
jgi:hypothetical protein